MKLKSKGIAIVTAAALAFGSTAAFTFAAAPGSQGGYDGPDGNMGGNNITVSAPANMGSSNFRTAGPNGINFGGSNTASNVNSPAGAPNMNGTDFTVNTPTDMNGQIPSDMGGNAPSGMNNSAPTGVPSDMGSGSPNMNGTDFTVNTPTDMNGQIPSDMGGNAPTDTNTDMPTPPDFSGNAPFDMSGSAPDFNEQDMQTPPDLSDGVNAPDRNMTPPDFSGQMPNDQTPTGELPEGVNTDGQPSQMFNGQAPTQTDIAARIIEENGLDLNVNEMSDEDIAALLEQYKPAEGEMPDMNDQNRPERPDMQNGGIFSDNNGFVGFITNIINKIASDYSIVFDAEQNIADKISEYINGFMPANSDQNRPTPPDLQQDQIPTDINSNANVA